VLTRWLSEDRSDATPELGSCRSEAGDLYLVCSDGLYAMVPATEIGRLLTEVKPGVDGLRDAAFRLVECANRLGGRDNVSVVLARCG
jgi:protein phosphatase